MVYVLQQVAALLPSPRLGLVPTTSSLIRIHLASRRRRAEHPGMLPPQTAARCSGHLLGKQQAKAFQHHVMYPPAGRRGGERSKASQEEGGWRGGTSGIGGSDEAVAAWHSSEPAELGCAAGKRSLRPSLTGREALRLAGISPTPSQISIFQLFPST